MNSRLKAVVFWLLMVTSAVVLWRTTRTDSRGFVWTGAFVVPFVLLTSWFRGRFSGSKKPVADVAVFSVCGMLLTSAIAAWSFELVSIGYGSQKNWLQGVIALIGFVACCSVLMWSILRLRKLPS
jgi:hypothetical protein